jgi:hypothetical protein
MLIKNAREGPKRARSHYFKSSIIILIMLTKFVIWTGKQVRKKRKRKRPKKGTESGRGREALDFFTRPYCVMMFVELIMDHLHYRLNSDLD